LLLTGCDRAPSEFLPGAGRRPLAAGRLRSGRLPRSFPRTPRRRSLPGQRWVPGASPLTTQDVLAGALILGVPHAAALPGVAWAGGLAKTWPPIALGPENSRLAAPHRHPASAAGHLGPARAAPVPGVELSLSAHDMPARLFSGPDSGCGLLSATFSRGRGRWRSPSARCAGRVATLGRDLAGPHRPAHPGGWPAQHPRLCWTRLNQLILDERPGDFLTLVPESWRVPPGGSRSPCAGQPLPWRCGVRDGPRAPWPAGRFWA